MGIKKMMSCVRLKTFGVNGEFNLDVIPVAAPKRGEVRILIKYAAFNRADCNIAEGHYNSDVCEILGLQILGLECSGIIDEIGDGVKDFSLGDEVYALTFGTSSNGSYAQYVVVPIQFVSKKPKNISLKQACCIPVAALTAYRCHLSSRFSCSKTPLFIAGISGGVGMFFAQMTTSLTKRPIFSLTRDEKSRIFLSKKLNIPKKNLIVYKNKSNEELEKELVSSNSEGRFISTFDFVGHDLKSLCINLTDFYGEIVSIVEEKNTPDIGFWESSGHFFSKSLTATCLFIGSEAFSGDQKKWESYSTHFSLINELLENKSIKPLETLTVGKLTTETVKKAHLLLKESGLRKKLIMKI